MHIILMGIKLMHVAKRKEKGQEVTIEIRGA